MDTFFYIFIGAVVIFMLIIVEIDNQNYKEK
jgi:hypothetical protein